MTSEDSDRSSDYAALSREIRRAGMLERRPAYYTVKIGTNAVLLAGCLALFLLGSSWYQLIVAAFLGVSVLPHASVGRHEPSRRQPGIGLTRHGRAHSTIAMPTPVPAFPPPDGRSPHSGPEHAHQGIRPSTPPTRRSGRRADRSSVHPTPRTRGIRPTADSMAGRRPCADTAAPVRSARHCTEIVPCPSFPNP